MEKQRLRNLTTRRLHTDISFIYHDLAFITGIDDLTTEMLPNVRDAVEPWLKSKVTDEEYWDGSYSPELKGEYELHPMNDQERKEFLDRYIALTDPLTAKNIKHFH